MSESQNLVQNDLNQAKQYTQKIIEELTQSMSNCRQRLQENPQSGQTQNQYNKNQQLIDSSKQQIHHIVNEYFKDISDNYVQLQSKYPNKQVKDMVLKQIESTLNELNDHSSKIQNNQFSQQDYKNFQLSNYSNVNDEVNKEVSNLMSQTQNVQKISKITQDSLPQVKVNHRVVEGLYLTLNEYATCQWPSDLPKQNLEKIIIQFNDYFPDINSAILPVIDEEKQEYGYYSLATQQTPLQMYQADEKPHYQPSITVASNGLIYLVGGVNPQGLIASTVHQLNPITHKLTKLPDMKVKRVGASVIYVPPSNLLPGKDGYLFVMGGRTDHKVKTKLCERYNIETKQWEDIARMEHAKARPGCCYDSANHTIYIFFGTDSYHQNINVVEKYDILANTWQSISLTNYLPGFDVTVSCAVQINQNQILLFGGLRDSLYFKDQMYFNRKVMLYNTHNDTFAVLDHQLPIDFLPIANPFVQNNQVYAIGTFMKSIDEQPEMYLDGAFVLQVNENGPKTIGYVPAHLK